MVSTGCRGKAGRASVKLVGVEEGKRESGVLLGTTLCVSSEGAENCHLQNLLGEGAPQGPTPATRY